MFTGVFLVFEFIDVFNFGLTSVTLFQFNKFYNLKHEEIQQKQNSLSQNFTNIFTKHHTDWLNLVSRLDELNPLKILSRGYSLVTKNGKTVTSAKNLEIEDKIQILFSEGNCTAVVNKTYTNKTDE